MDKLEDAGDNEYGFDIYDPTSIKWNEFAWNNGYFSHKLSSNEILKPYLLSFQYYGTVEYEYLILELNKITDIWAVVPGTEIRIPKLTDIKAFLLKNKK